MNIKAPTPHSARFSQGICNMFLPIICYEHTTITWIRYYFVSFWLSLCFYGYCDLIWTVFFLFVLQLCTDCILWCNRPRVKAAIEDKRRWCGSQSAFLFGYIGHWKCVHKLTAFLWGEYIYWYYCTVIMRNNFMQDRLALLSLTLVFW